jgi:hypothetical protein
VKGENLRGRELQKKQTEKGTLKCQGRVKKGCNEGSK